jgi:hypothetical protein
VRPTYGSKSPARSRNDSTSIAPVQYIAPVVRVASPYGYEDLPLTGLLPEPKRGPVGRTQKVVAVVSELSRRQQEKIIEFVEAIVAQHERWAS